MFYLYKVVCEQLTKYHIDVSRIHKSNRLMFEKYLHNRDGTLQYITIPTYLIRTYFE